MNSLQYEELCRFFLAQQTGMRAEEILSGRIPNPKRADLPQYQHQVDLYWETGNDVCLYLNIANAKWRGCSKVDQGEVLLLQQVKQKVAAHKAVMICNTEFTSGAEAAARDDGIALHIVRPSFDTSVLHASDRSLIQSKLQTLASGASEPLFQHTVCHRAYDLGASTSPSSGPGQAVPSPVATRVLAGSATRVITGTSNRGSFGGSEKPGAAGSGTPARGGFGGFRTR